MALVADDYIRPVKALGLSSIPMMELKKATSTVCYRGMIVIATTGLAVAAADSPATATLLGVCVEDITAAQALTQVRICPALSNVIFQGATATGAAGATTTITDANLFTPYELALNSSIWYVNVGASTDAVVGITERLEADSTAWAKVEFMFLDSFFNAR